MKYFAGIDQGYTKTDVLIGDENGRLLARHIGPGWGDDFFGVQTACAENALSQCGLKLPDVYAFVSSMTEIDTDDIQKKCEADFRERVSNKNSSVYHDSYGAWRTGTNRRPSGAMSLGSGVALAFFHENGSLTNLSDLILWEYQTASTLGLRAFGRACAAALKYWEPTLLTENICEFTETSTLEEAFAKTDCGSDISAMQYQHFAPYVFAAAEKNDKVSIDLIREIGTGLAGYIRSGIKNLGWEDREVPFVLSGGALKGKGYILENVIRENLSGIPNLNLIRARYEPVYGALMLAYDEYHPETAPSVSSEDIQVFNLYRELMN